MKLIREPIDSLARRVMNLPRYYRPKSPDGYWHIPRSAQLMPPYMPRKSTEWRLCAQMLCGVHPSKNKRENFTDRLPRGARVCATCYGRRLAFEAERYAFEPRDHWSFPKVCPGVESARDDLCETCGEVARYYQTRAWDYSQKRHAPGPGLKLHRPCPKHGWRDLRPDGRTLRCTTWRCDYVSAARRGRRP